MRASSTATDFPQVVDGRGARAFSAALGGLSTILALTGVIILADVAVTAAWQEPLTALYARQAQRGLAQDLRRLVVAEAARTRQLRTSERVRVADAARSLKHRTKLGSAVGRIRIPLISADYVIVNGTDTATLRKGPGIYPQTPFPGAPGTTAIAGHRTTYLAPFRHIDRLGPGRSIEIMMPYGDLHYSVEKVRVVDPSDFGVIKSVGYERLVLSACHPPFSAAKRIIVFARLTRIGPPVPAADAGRPPGHPATLVLWAVAVAVLLLAPLGSWWAVAWLRGVSRTRRRDARAK